MRIKIKWSQLNDQWHLWAWNEEKESWFFIQEFYDCENFSKVFVLENGGVLSKKKEYISYIPKLTCKELSERRTCL